MKELRFNTPICTTRYTLIDGKDFGYHEQELAGIWLDRKLQFRLYDVLYFGALQAFATWRKNPDSEEAQKRYEEIEELLHKFYNEVAIKEIL